MSIILPDLLEDATLHGLDAASCCTNCATYVLAGAGNQVVDERGRVHRHCAKCHAELMTPDPKPLSSQLGKSADPGPTSAGQGPDLPENLDASACRGGRRNEARCPLAREGIGPRADDRPEKQERA